MTQKQIELSATATHGHLSLSDPDYSFKFYRSVNELDLDWEIAQPSENLYLQTPFLQALETAPPQRMRFCYLVFYKNQTPLGVAYCQIANFKTDQSVQDMESSTGAPGILKSLGVSIKNFVAKRFEFNLLVCGNLCLTGEHGFHFDYQVLDKKKCVGLLEEALEITQKELLKQKIRTDGIFIKDIDESANSCNRQLKEQSFREFIFHPNMVLYLSPSWNSFDDYLQAITSKYRVRVKKALKQGQSLEKVELDESQLIANVSRLYELYRKVMASAGFNMVILHENYIVQLKRQLGDNFHVTGYYLDGELVGYRTNIVNHEEVEAHFLGYDSDLNRDHKLYMNMLIDSLKFGLEQGANRVVFARTAMEIKSSIGAVPEDLHCYIRANNRFANRVLSPVLEYFRPADDWVQRKPFKDQN